MRGAALWLVSLSALVLSCDKVPLGQADVVFKVADATWFEEEETLFVFYEVHADQGLVPQSEVEVSYRTDPAVLDWTPVHQLPSVHRHLPTDCGPRTLCGSTSLHVPALPSRVELRLRYHRDGELFLDTNTHFNVIRRGPPSTHRSLVVYGVFDETNARIQWRARHQFPALRNHQTPGTPRGAEDYGLRRSFRVESRRHGALPVQRSDDPYGYGSSGPGCPAGMAALEPLTLGTSDRAIFEPAPLPLSTSDSPAVCATSTVSDARGEFQAVAFARKNPQVRPAFPVLRSPITANRQVQFLLRLCNQEGSASELASHLGMQRQRLLLDGVEETCVDDWRSPAFSARLATLVRDRTDAARREGRDMVLVVALHHDVQGGQLGREIERALGPLLLLERDKSTPRVSGAFVFDSFGRSVSDPALSRLLLWCPTTLDFPNLDQIPGDGLTVCPLWPDVPDAALGPFRFNTLPILPTRAQYLSFIARYSEAQAGSMKELRFLAPARTTTSQTVPHGPFGQITFFNNEVLDAAREDAFSYCPPAGPEGCAGPSSPEACAAAVVRVRSAASREPFPIDQLPRVHAASPQRSYALGLYWEYPFLLRLQYEIIISGAASAYGLTVPFGVGVQNQAYSSARLWERGEFPLSGVLEQCTRFCDHPTFDDAGAYQILAPYRPTYQTACYRPRFPTEADGGFPLDP